MNPEQIEILANQACFSTNPEIKFNAQKIFMDFTFSLKPSEYSWILQNFSQTVLFVFLSYLNKKLQKSKQIVEIFQALKQHTLLWLKNSCHLQRSRQNQELKTYVANTLGMVLGTCMKYIFLDDKLKFDLIQYLKEQQNSTFKVFLYKNFIQIVATIDNDLEYVNYRTLIYSFQDEIIPLIIKQIYPYFVSLTDNIKIDELSHMLPILNQKQTRPQYYLFRREDKIMCQNIFSTLRQIMTFKFNITISQFDLETEFDNCMISFPESILIHIISRQFLQAFYFMLQKMVLLQQPDNYFEISVQCLKKILLTKTIRIGKEQRIALTRIHYNGIFRLTKIHTKSQKILNQVFQCACKFIHAFQFSQIEEANLNHLQWVNLIKQKTLLILPHVHFSNQNYLYRSICELIFKIASQSVQMSQQKFVNAYEQLCRDFYRVFFDAFISKSQSIFGKTQVQKISDLQQILNDFFYHINKVGSMDMGFMFNVIASRVQEVYNSGNTQKISNFLFLISQIIQESFYDRNIVFEATSDEDLKILGMLIHKSFKFIDSYKQMNVSQPLIDVAILLFFQRILNECLSLVSEEDNTIINMSTTYNIINSYQKIKTTDQMFLLFCFNQLGLSLYTEDQKKVEYILDKFYNLLVKLKWAIKREYFSQCQICRDILDLTYKLSRDSLQSNLSLLKERRKLFKIITILSFDDIMDSYKTNINFVAEALQYDFTQNKYQKIVFDLAGISQNIDTAPIYKYFLEKINQKIGLKNLIKRLYQTFGGDMQMLQQVVYLNKSMITDKALRMSNKQLSIFLYELIDISLPFLTTILNSVNGEGWSEVFREVLIFCDTIFQSSYINLYLIKRKSQNNFLQFLYAFIESILKNNSWAQSFPQLSRQMFESMRSFLIGCSQIVLCWQQQSNAKNQLIFKCIQLIQCSIYFIEKNLNQVDGGSKEQKQNGQKLLDSIAKLYSFMRYKKNFLHKVCMLENIHRVISQNQSVTIKFIEYLYKMSLSNLKSYPSVLKNIGLAIMQLSYFYPNCYLQIFSNLGIPNQKVSKFKLIYGRIEQGKDDQYFVINLKEWLAKSDNNYQKQIEY